MWWVWKEKRNGLIAGYRPAHPHLVDLVPQSGWVWHKVAHGSH